MTESWEELPIEEALEKCRESLSEFELDDRFFRKVLSTIPGGRNKLFLEFVVQKYENEIELLGAQIQSYDFRNPQEFCQNLPPPVQREIVLSPELQFEYDLGSKGKTEGSTARVITDDVTDPSSPKNPESYLSFHAHIQEGTLLPEDLRILCDLGSKGKTEGSSARLITEDAAAPLDPEGPKSCRSLPSSTQEKMPPPADSQTLHDSIEDSNEAEEVLSQGKFIDPIADYMELWLNKILLTCFLSEDRKLQRQVMEATILVVKAYARMMLLRSETISQQVYLVSQLLKWLHWLFDFT